LYQIRTEIICIIWQEWGIEYYCYALSDRV